NASENRITDISSQACGRGMGTGTISALATVAAPITAVATRVCRVVSHTSATQIAQATRKTTKYWTLKTRFVARKATGARAAIAIAPDSVRARAASPVRATRTPTWTTMASVSAQPGGSTELNCGWS